eukprot:8027171-Pyramimonas_sp.AAC.1
MGNWTQGERRGRGFGWGVDCTLADIGTGGPAGESICWSPSKRALQRRIVRWMCSRRCTVHSAALWMGRAGAPLREPLPLITPPSDSD